MVTFVATSPSLFDKGVVDEACSYTRTNEDVIPETTS